MARGECLTCGATIDTRAGYHDCDFKGRIARLESDLARVQAEAASMREALESLRPHKSHEDLCAANFDEGPCDCTFGMRHAVIDRTSGTNAGRALAEEVELLNDVFEAASRLLHDGTGLGILDQAVEAVRQRRLKKVSSE